jgi:hypothetical protein
LLAQDVTERGSTDIGQVAETGLAAPRGLHELVGNRLSAFMIAPVRKFSANFVKHNIHVGLRTLVKFAQFNAPVTSPAGLKTAWHRHGHYHFFPTLGTARASWG